MAELFYCFGEISKDIVDDREAFDHYKSILPETCDRLAGEQGAKRAEGQQWHFRWNEITQEEVDLYLSSTGLDFCYFDAGGMRFKATALCDRI
jgi:hypothetical protein